MTIYMRPHTDPYGFGNVLKEYKGHATQMYYEWLQLRILRHLAATGGQTPLSIPWFGLCGDMTIHFDFDLQFENWAAWLGGLVDGTTQPSYGYYDLTDEEWDRLQAYTDNWDYIEPVPWMTEPILGGLVDEN